MKDKTIYLLIGQKGSGKSFIGALLEKHFGLRFLGVEEWAKAVQRDRAIEDTGYVEEVFRVIEHGVREALLKRDNVAFESTGLTPFFDQMLVSLKCDFNVVLIKVEADRDTCFERVKTRDASIHIEVSDEQLRALNHQILAKNLATDFILINEGKTEEELVEELEKYTIFSGETPFSFKCTSCGEVHTEMPSLESPAPIYYFTIPRHELAKRAVLTEDTCVLDDAHFYVKGCLELPIINGSSSFSMIAWISLSRVNFEKFEELFEVENREDNEPMVGWFSSQLYPFTETEKLVGRIHFRNNGLRPLIELEPTEHTLAVCQRAGISEALVGEILEYYLHESGISG